MPGLGWQTTHPSSARGSTQSCTRRTWTFASMTRACGGSKRGISNGLAAMASRRLSRRNPYRPGTISYARFRRAALKRRAALAKANIDRANTPETRRRTRRRVSATQRALQAVERREEFRSKLSERDRGTFAHLTIGQQELIIAVNREYPDSVPKDIPDPFAGRQREALWRLSYSTRAGIRLRAVA